MARTISSPFVGTFVLSLTDPNATNGSDNPLIVTSTITSSTGDGIDGAAATDWLVFNTGIVAGENTGIDLSGAGRVGNTGLIEAANFDGVEIGGFGVVYNKGTIAAGFSPSFQPVGVAIGGSGLVYNLGTIKGMDGGLTIADAGIVVNSGLISAEFLTASLDIGGFGEVINTGTIFGQDAGGVVIGGGGVVRNGPTALIFGHSVGVMITGGTGEVTNLGSIAGLLDGGVELFGGGTVRNSGSIFGTFGVNIRDGGSVINVGTISGQVGVSISGGGSVTNAGSIDGGVTIDFGTVTNDGTISCALSPLDPVDSVMMGPGDGSDTLIVDPGAVFNGPAVAAGRETNTLELAPGNGTIGGIGNGQFLGFRTLDVEAGATWTLTGANKIATVLNSGLLNVAGSLTVTNAVDPSSTGTFMLAGGASLEVASALGIASTISFTSGSDLIVDNFAAFGVNVGMSTYAGSLLENFGGASIDLKTFGLAGVSTSFSPSGLLQLTNSSAQAATLDFQTSSLGTGTFHVGTDGGSGVLITYS
jgi:hypothetical protein